MSRKHEPLTEKERAALIIKLSDEAGARELRRLPTVTEISEGHYSLGDGNTWKSRLPTAP